MENNPENLSAVDDVPESKNYESEPSGKHQIYIEQNETRLTEERREYLADAIGDKARGRTTENAEYYEMLDDWKQRCPQHASVIQELEQKGGLVSVVAESWNLKDRGKINDVQALLKDALISYGNKWEELTEAQKRAVRVAEMTVFISDTTKMGIDLVKTNNVNVEAANNVIKKMDWYSKSVDIPMSFRDGFLKPAMERLREDLSRVSSSSSQKGPHKRRNTEGEHQEVQSSEIVQEETGRLEGPEEAVMQGSDKNIIDMEYDPNIGGYASIEETAKQEQAKSHAGELRRLGYETRQRAALNTPEASTNPPAPKKSMPDVKLSQTPTSGGGGSGGGGEGAAGGGFAGGGAVGGGGAGG